MNLVTVMKSLAAITWLAFFAVIVFVVVRAARDKTTKGATSLVVIVLVVTLLINTVSAGLVFVEPTERGVVVSALAEGGVREEAILPGIHWVVPFFDRVVKYTISRQAYTMTINPDELARLGAMGDPTVEARTSDGQVVYVDGSIIFAINPNEVVQVHIDWQNTYVDRLIRNLARGIIRNSVAVYGVEEVYSSQRLAVTEDIRAELQRKLEEEGFVLVDFVLRNIAFSEEYAASVEQKQIAEQLAQQAIFVVEQRRQEAEQARQQAQGQADAQVILAQGQAEAIIIQATAEAEARLIQANAEAEALRLLAAAIAVNPDVLTLQYIEALAPNIRVMLLPSNATFILPFPDDLSSSVQ